MSGDWIKMRGNLWDDPRVGALVDATDSSEAAVIGGLYWLWAAADQHTEDGFMPGLSLRQIDRKTGIKGFAEALQEIGWIVPREEGVEIVRFQEHNGASAKRRGMEAKRKANVRSLSARDADKAQTETGHGAELEKEKEIDIAVGEITTTPPAGGGAVVIEGVFEGHADPKPAEVHPATAAAIALRKAGIRTTGMNPDLIAAVEAGVTVEHLLELASLHPDKPIAYLCRAAQRERAETPPPVITGQPRAGPRMQPSKTALGIASLENLKNEARQHMAAGGDCDGATEARGALAGPHAGR